MFTLFFSIQWKHIIANVICGHVHRMRFECYSWGQAGVQISGRGPREKSRSRSVGGWGCLVLCTDLYWPGCMKFVYYLPLPHTRSLCLLSFVRFYSILSCFSLFYTIHINKMDIFVHFGWLLRVYRDSITSVSGTRIHTYTIKQKLYLARMH